MDIKERFYANLNVLREEVEQLDELRGKGTLSDKEKKELQDRIYNKHGEAWEKTKRKRKALGSKGSADTKDLDQFRNRLGAMYKKLEEAKANKPARSEHSWPTKLNKKTGKWSWANSFTGGHASAEDADRHAKMTIEKNKKTKVKLSSLKPGS